MFLNTHPSTLVAHAHDRMASAVRRAERAERVREARRGVDRASAAHDDRSPRTPALRLRWGRPTAGRHLARLRRRLRLHLGSAR